MSIKAERITKIYGEQKALDDVSFTINTGEIVGFLGPNGAGKSTMMKIITGFIPPTSGDVFVNGISIYDDSGSISRTIGYLPENNPLYPEMFVREYLDFVAGLYGVKKNKSNRISEIIEMTGLGPEKTKKIGALSKGYRQRVGLAQVLLHDPKVLILDEPTSGLDPNQIVEIRSLISEVGRNKTVMLSTHIMQEVEAICDKVIIVKSGKIVAHSSTEDIKKTRGSVAQTISVEFDKGIDISTIEAIKGIVKVVALEGNQWILQSDLAEDIRPSIFEFAVSNNLKVLAMQEQKQSLEKAFRELTGGK